MKSIFLSALIFLSSVACNKKIDEIREDMVVKAMVDGQWRVTKFHRDASDVTSGFSVYKFQFHSNNTVDAINNNSIENTGSWNGNAANRTIASSFTNANSTISLLNGTWQITKNSWTFVEATQTVNNEIRTLRLDK